MNTHYQGFYFLGLLKELKNILVLLAATVSLVSCTGGGRLSTLINEPLTLLSVEQPYQTIDPIEYNYDTVHGNISVRYSSGVYKDENQFPKTDKYEIADYGFFQIYTEGMHDGTSRNPLEVQDAGPFIIAGFVHRADLNGDGYQDFLYEGGFEGDRDDMPRSYLHAFLNDGFGHFIYSPEIFADQTPPCINYGDLDYKKDPYHECGFVRHHQRSLVADFNGDGMDDFFKSSILHLSQNGKLENKSHSNLPEWMFAIDDDPSSDKSGYGAYSHDIYAGDIDNDGDLDIFGAWSHDAEPTNHTMGVLINDGTGVFADTNWNFYLMPPPEEVGTDHVLWNTTAAIGDFDNDGYTDVAVGWANPGKAEFYGFADSFQDSAGAVFWNDGNMDWSKYWSELPSNYWGDNGIANDMEVMDFNNDGLLDIVLASTKADPYYVGRVIQLFLNDGNRSFSDVSEQYGSITHYTSGSGSNWWNGEGSLHILDFDADGDLDIVDSVNSTYVLLNEDGYFQLYDDLPDQGECGGCRYFPIEIDNKWQYDFIGFTDERTIDSATATFFQVLDPPLAQMIQDITTKPSGYASSIFNSKILLNDLRSGIGSNNLMYSRLEGSEMLGFSYHNLFFADFSGQTEGILLGLDFIRGPFHFAYYFADRTIESENETLWYGTGIADIDVKSHTGLLQYSFTFGNNFLLNFGYSQTWSSVDSFIERDSIFNVMVNDFKMVDGNVFADIVYSASSSFGLTRIGAGIDHNFSLDKTIIHFGDGLEYKFKEEATRGNINLTHYFGSIYLRGKFDTKGRTIAEIGFRVNL